MILQMGKKVIYGITESSFFCILQPRMVEIIQYELLCNGFRNGTEILLKVGNRQIIPLAETLLRC